MHSHAGAWEREKNSGLLAVIQTCLLCSVFGIAAASAEIVFDGSLGPNKNVSPTDNNGYSLHTIHAKMGSQAGGNLFHSFRTFNLNDNDIAYFDGDDSIRNIISRVTGGKSSSINGGLVSYIPDVDLYFINPAGIVFGADAWLDIEGSFYVSTADYLRLGEERFETGEPLNSRISIAPPSAFGFISPQPAAISVHNNNTGYLQVKEGNRISLTGGDINLSDSRITAPGGEINIISTASPGEAPVKTDILNDNAFAEYGAVSISDSTEGADNLQRQYGNLEVSGEGGGRIYIRSGRLEMDNGYVFADTFGNRDGQGIMVEADGEILLKNSARMTAEAVPFGEMGIKATGHGGDINVAAGQLVLLSGGELVSATRTAGNAGNISVTARDSIYAAGSFVVSEDNIHDSGIISNTLGTGNAGQITMQAPVITLAENAVVRTKGNRISLTGGDINLSDSIIAVPGGKTEGASVRAEENRISLTGSNINLSDSIIAAPGGEINVISAASPEPVKYGVVSISDSTEGADNIQRKYGNLDVSGEGGGRIYIRSGRLEMDNGYVFADTSGNRDGRGIMVEADGEILLKNGARLTAEAIDSSEMGANATGHGGDINVAAGQLTLLGGGELASGTRTAGNAGNISVTARDSIYAAGGFVASENNIHDSGIISSTLSTGKAGQITMRAPMITLTEGASVRTETQGSGHAGTIRVDTGRLVLKDGGRFNVNAGDSLSENINTGNAGNLEIIAADSVEISGKIIDDDIFSGLSVNTWTAGKGGGIALDAPVVKIKDHGIIQAGTRGYAEAGNISINTERLELDGKGGIHAITKGEARGGDIIINAREEIRIARSRDDVLGNISSSTRGSGNGGNIVLSTSKLDIFSQGRIESGTETGAKADGRGGNIKIQAENTRLSAQSRISTQSTGSGNAGDIELSVTDLRIDDKAAITTRADRARGGNINIETAAGGRIHLRRESTITAQAQGDQEHDRGGNITIGNPDEQELRPKFVILDKSNIIAKAKGGDGGNITISANTFLRSSDSLVDASSEKRLDGEIRINAPDENADSGLLPRHPKFLGKAELSRSCQTQTDATRFLVHGREAVPDMPDDWLSAGPLAEIETRGLEHDMAGLVRCGLNAFAQGLFEEAATSWKQALPELKQAGHGEIWIDVSSLLAAAYQNMGMYYAVFPTLDQAMLAAEKTDDLARQALLLSQFSDAWLALGRTQDATEIAQRSVAMAKKAGMPAISARALNNLANAFVVQGVVKKKGHYIDDHYAKALEAYQRALEQAELAKKAKKILRAKINLNRLNALWSSNEPSPEEAAKRAARQLEASQELHTSLADGQAKAMLLTAAGILAENLWRENPANYPLDGVVRGYQAAAEAGGNHRIRSIVYGRLGRLYEDKRRYDEALALTNRALFDAGQPDLSFRWLWQQARIYKQKGNRSASIRKYRLAVNHLKAVQTMLSIGYRNPVRGFEQWVRPVYYGLIDLLLTEARTAEHAARKQELLKKAGRYIEKLKVVEIQDYFRDECLLANSDNDKSDKPLPKRTAVLYPIPLEDRLELLLRLGDTFYQESVLVDSNSLNKAAKQFRRHIQTRTRWHFLRSGKRLYNWLIHPLEEKFLSPAQVDTLIIVPDGQLRTISFAALNNGKEYLIDKYALAVSPEFSPRTQKAADWQKARFLLAGTFYVEGYPPLPKVPLELAGIQSLAENKALHSKKLLDKKFSKAEFKRLFEKNAYTVVHLATHGEFNADPENTWLLAHDRKIYMDELQAVVGLGRYREQKLELLTLSACKTAVGDDRAALGLAGVAIKAGARSALASLWYVDDEATSVLMREFYDALLNKHEPSKAKALQRAQRSLLKSPSFRHPAYWAPFLLIGDWS
ncbi:MAG: CHAT domain-containing protein [Gammaproteobacteria bacterium]|nr:CHAT domain-containing protein [Gammaproteobacteria bacterium]